MYFDGDFFGQEGDENDNLYLQDQPAPIGEAAPAAHLTGIEIRGRVRNLSDGLWQMTQISRLSLCNNLLTTIPPGIKNLINLTYLDASNNCLESLPREIGDLQNLRELIIDQNHIKELPIELGKLQHLGYVSIADNPLEPHIIELYNREGTHGLIEHLRGMYAQHAMVIHSATIGQFDARNYALDGTTTVIESGVGSFAYHHPANLEQQTPLE